MLGFLYVRSLHPGLFVNATPVREKASYDNLVLRLQRWYGRNACYVMCHVMLCYVVMFLRYVVLWRLCYVMLYYAIYVMKARFLS